MRGGSFILSVVLFVNKMFSLQPSTLQNLFFFFPLVCLPFLGLVLYVSLTLCHTFISLSHPLSLLVPTSLHTFEHTHTHTHAHTQTQTHTITQQSLLRSLMSATEVRVWVFCPRATQPCFTVTVTPALPCNSRPSLTQVILLPPHHDNGTAVNPPGHTLRHMFTRSVMCCRARDRRDRTSGTGNTHRGSLNGPGMRVRPGFGVTVR